MCPALSPVVPGLSGWGAALSPKPRQDSWLDQLRGFLICLQTLKSVDSQGNFAYLSYQPRLPLTPRTNLIVPLHKPVQGFETIEQNQQQSVVNKTATECARKEKTFPVNIFVLSDGNYDLNLLAKPVFKWLESVSYSPVHGPKSVDITSVINIHQHGSCHQAVQKGWFNWYFPFQIQFAVGMWWEMHLTMQIFMMLEHKQKKKEEEKRVLLFFWEAWNVV